MTHSPSIIAPRAINRWAIWAVSLKVQNGLDFQLPKLPINKSVDNFVPPSSMWFGARAASQRWTASTMTQTAQGNDPAHFRSRFCFGLVGWLEGGG
jgi:hypothetical protein